jgi:hypothetical protein
MACKNCIRQHIAGAEKSGNRGSVVWHLLKAAAMTEDRHIRRELERARLDYQREKIIPDWEYLRGLTDAED